MKKTVIIVAFISGIIGLTSCNPTLEVDSSTSDRKTISLNNDWKFAFGHSYNRILDFGHARSSFSYVAKAGNGDGAADKDFDDRMWRNVNIPHDWCVELPFSSRSNANHGSKAIGEFFPKNNIGWYRHTFRADTTLMGKRINLEFEGVFRNARVWLNGFYLGEEHSGYNSFSYDITEYLNYFGNNVIAVRVDASMHEGWFYEGAGIYRNVNLVITNPLHVENTFITTDELSESNAELTVRTLVENETDSIAEFVIIHQIIDTTGTTVSEQKSDVLQLKPLEKRTFYADLLVHSPKMWTVWDEGTPYLYTAKTIIYNTNKKIVVDEYKTEFGIRTVKFTADKGFFLNGKPLKIRGVCLHQDHAGVGIALTPELQEFRIAKMQGMGANAIRTAHHPASPDFLKACDRMGMLVMEELRLMGVTPEHKANIDKMIIRDRNHPSIFIWSLGNEEWSIEGTERGAMIAHNMERYARTLDSSRAYTVASSGSWDKGIGKTTEVCGISYINHGDVDKHHNLYPNQPVIGTEESTTVSTRGIYFTNDSLCHLAPTNLYDEGIRSGWKFYSSRPWAAGLFYWSGMDYRGEPTPYDYPAVVSQFGITDLCGFEKDCYYYLASWWTKKNVLHIGSHWTYNPNTTDSIRVPVYSNCHTVELMINRQSMGKKVVPENDFVTFKVPYEPGTIIAFGYDKDGNTICGNNDGNDDNSIGISRIETAQQTTSLQLSAFKNKVKEGELAIITIKAVDSHKYFMPTANDNVHIRVEGPASIVGLGNGNPSSLEPEVYLPKITIESILNLEECNVSSLDNIEEVLATNKEWSPAFVPETDVRVWNVYRDTLKVVRGTFYVDDLFDDTKVTLYPKSVLNNQNMYINGHVIKVGQERSHRLDAMEIPHEFLKEGKNEYAVSGQKFRKTQMFEDFNTDPGRIHIYHPALQSNRKLFNGYAQVLVRINGTKQPVKIKAFLDTQGSTGEIIINPR